MPIFGNGLLMDGLAALRTVRLFAGLIFDEFTHARSTTAMLVNTHDDWSILPSVEFSHTEKTLLLDFVGNQVLNLYVH